MKLRSLAALTSLFCCSICTPFTSARAAELPNSILANLVANPSFETNTTGWSSYGSGATMTRVSGGHTGGYSVQCKGPSSTSSHFGIQDSPNVVATVAGVGTRYRFGCWVRSAASKGLVKIKVKEFLGSTQKGSTAYATGVTLSTAWQFVTVDYVVTAAGTTLDMVIEDYPVAGYETYFIDDVSVEIVSSTTTSPPPPTDDPPIARLSVSPLTTALAVQADASASTDVDATPIATYRFDFGDGTTPVTTSAPTAVAQHTYATGGTYAVSVIVKDTGGKASTPATASITVSAPTSSASVALYVGYYDTHHSGYLRAKPNPWKGSPGVVFVGTPDPGTTNGWDTSALRLDNLTGSTISNVVVSVDIGSKRFALWGSRSIAAGQKLILAQTAFENFDGSDTSPAGCYGCSPNDCITKVSHTLPVVHVTINGVRTDYVDTKQILNTHGVDAAGCPYTGTRNDESEAWQQPALQSALIASSQSDDSEPEPFVASVDLSLSLAPPYPNPTGGMTTLAFRMPSAGETRLIVYDVAGRAVRTVIDGLVEPGEYHAQVDLGGLPGGVYFASLVTPSGTVHRTVILTR